MRNLRLYRIGGAPWRRVRPGETTYALTNLDYAEVALPVQQNPIMPATQPAFNRMLTQKKKIHELSENIADHKRESDPITADQNRIRENRKALKGTSGERALLQRYVAQPDSQETRLPTLRRESKDLTDRHRVELDRMILDVNVDETFWPSKIAQLKALSERNMQIRSALNPGRKSDLIGLN
jgi:hypothetical protein